MSVLNLSEAKSHLNITTTINDGELQQHIDAAEAAIVEKCGPLTSVAVTERVRGGGTGLVLRETPVVSLTSVTPVNGTAYDLDDLDLDTSAGVIEWGSGARFQSGRYDVVYQAGRASVPNDLLSAIKELVRHSWQTQRGPGRGAVTTVSDASSNTIPGAGYAWPFRVTELIAPHVQVGNG
jgi:hypothetical protein